MLPIGVVFGTSTLALLCKIIPKHVELKYAQTSLRLLSGRYQQNHLTLLRALRIAARIISYGSSNVKCDAMADCYLAVKQLDGYIVDKSFSGHAIQLLGLCR